MKIVLEFMLDFVCIFLIFVITYTVFINKRKLKYSKLKNNDEIVIFVKRYKLDVNRIDYNKLVKYLGLINSFIIAFTSALIININNFWWSLLVSFIVIIFLIYSLFEILGRYFKNMEGKENV